MAAEDHLVQIVGDMAALEQRCVSTPLGMRLQGEDAANHKRLAVEAKSILDSELGLLNNFSTKLLTSGISQASVLETRKVIEGAVNHMRRRPGLGQGQNAVTRPWFVSTVRLAELRSLPNTRWDFARLVRLCEEINVCHANGCFMATAMLIRGITDHIPPVFGLKTFTEVANNYADAQSFRASMKNLDNSLRNIADAHLHVRIRRSEALPTEAQVSFQADLDVLLAEIVRVAK